MMSDCIKNGLLCGKNDMYVFLKVHCTHTEMIVYFDSIWALNQNQMNASNQSIQWIFQ